VSTGDASWSAVSVGVTTALAEAGHTWSDYFDDAADASVVRSFPLSANDLGVLEGAGFGERCFVHLGPAAEAKVRHQQARLRIRRMGSTPIVDDVHVYVADFSNKLSVTVGSPGTLFCGRLGAVVLEVSLGHDGLLVIGDAATINGAKVVAINGRILIKRGAMIADEVLIQGSDQHGIVDLATGAFVNHGKRFVHLGRHTWIGRRVTLLPGVAIGDGAIVGACSVVTKEVPSCCVAAGVPARVVRENVSWSRTWDTLDADAVAFMDEIQAPFRNPEE